VREGADSFHSGNLFNLPGRSAEDILRLSRHSEGTLDLFAFDKQYVDRLRDSEPATEHHFVSYFGQILGVMLRARGLSQERVDDVRQETLARVIAALRREGGIRYPERFGAFVNSTCKNVLRESFRQFQREQPLDADHFDFPDKIVDLERALISDETKKKVRQILEEMNKRDRELLAALFLEEKDKEQICREFGVEREYLRVLLHRAKERFRSYFLRANADLPGRTTGIRIG
jgi:RNA polymerase sigma-70 factor, ECF subfamily